MTHAAVDLDLHKGDDKILNVTVLDENDAAVDISGATEIRWGLAAQAGAAPSLEKTKTGGAIAFPGGGTDGVFEVTLAAADTMTLAAGPWYHEAELTLGGKAETVLHGTALLIDTSLN